MKFSLRLRLLALFAALPSAPAGANDAVSAVSGGNIYLKESPSVSMDSEVLRVSPRQVTVNYEFTNRAASAIKHTVTFPFSEMNSEVPYSIGPLEPWAEGKDPTGFRVVVDGQEKPFKVLARKSFAPGDDANEESPYSLNVSHYWEQEFPAGKTLKVTHTYRPILGSGAPAEWKTGGDYCADAAFVKALDGIEDRLKTKIVKLLRANAERPQVRAVLARGELLEDHAARIASNLMHFQAYGHFSYILQTAKTWAGPIKSFRLVIEKDEPSTLVSLCWDGLKKISPTTFEFTRANFVPPNDLSLVFVNDVSRKKLSAREVLSQL